MRYYPCLSDLYTYFRSKHHTAYCSRFPYGRYTCLFQSSFENMGLSCPLQHIGNRYAHQSCWHPMYCGTRSALPSRILWPCEPSWSSRRHPRLFAKLVGIQRPFFNVFEGLVTLYSSSRFSSLFSKPRNRQLLSLLVTTMHLPKHYNPQFMLHLVSPAFSSYRIYSEHIWKPQSLGLFKPVIIIKFCHWPFPMLRSQFLPGVPLYGLSTSHLLVLSEHLRHPGISRFLTPEFLQIKPLLRNT